MFATLSNGILNGTGRGVSGGNNAHRSFSFKGGRGTFRQNLCSSTGSSAAQPPNDLETFGGLFLFRTFQVIRFFKGKDTVGY